MTNTQAVPSLALSASMRLSPLIEEETKGDGKYAIPSSCQTDQSELRTTDSEDEEDDEADRDTDDASNWSTSTSLSIGESKVNGLVVESVSALALPSLLLPLNNQSIHFHHN
jgi:hypothetical protein